MTIVAAASDHTRLVALSARDLHGSKVPIELPLHEINAEEKGFVSNAQ